MTNSTSDSHPSLTWNICDVLFLLLTSIAQPSKKREFQQSERKCLSIKMQNKNVNEVTRVGFSVYCRFKWRCCFWSEKFLILILWSRRNQRWVKLRWNGTNGRYNWKSFTSWSVAVSRGLWKLSSLHHHIRLFPPPPSPCFREMSILFNLILQRHETSSICFRALETSGVGGFIENICSLRATFEVILIIESMGSLNCCRHDFHLVSLSHYFLECYQWQSSSIQKKSRKTFLDSFSLKNFLS